MSKTVTIQTRIDPLVKKNALEILNKLNITMSDAISMYLAQIVLQRGIPFELKVPNVLTAKTLEDSEKGNNLHTVHSLDQLFEELES